MFIQKIVFPWRRIFNNQIFNQRSNIQLFHTFQTVILQNFQLNEQESGTYHGKSNMQMK